MSHRRNLTTRAFGAEPGIPDPSLLAAWVAGRRGRAGDLISYQIETVLAPQRTAGIAVPCTGGRFYRDRLCAAFSGIEEGVIRGETGILPEALFSDAGEMAALSRGIWFALPAPHLLDITDRYYGDADEAADALRSLYRSAMRTMRDGGAGGHVLICDRADETEIASLARQKILFFHPEPAAGDLEILLEYQRQVAVGPAQLGSLFSLAGEYEIGRLILLDPDERSIAACLSRLDPDQLAIGGYCTGSCDTYWQDLVERAYGTA